MPKKQPEVIFLDDSGETGMQNFASKLVNWGLLMLSELGQDREGVFCVSASYPHVVVFKLERFYFYRSSN